MDNTKTAEQPEITATPATGGITLKTALRILDTISRNANEGVGFWASKTAYSGVYRTAVQNGWIEDGVFVTDIPEGVDGGFLAADMRRIALMARLLADVLSDRLPEQETVPSKESTSAAIQASIDSAVREHLKDFLSEQELDVAIAEAFASAMEELEVLKDEIEALKDEALAEIESAKTE